MTQSSISIDIDDPRTGLVAEALANKTCVKILGLLAEEELTAGDVAIKLKIPLNTTGYNLEKLIACGLIEKSSSFFWSVKGKKTPVYKVANRRIVISPKRIIKGVVPAVILSGVAALLLRSFSVISSSTPSVTQFAETSIQATADSGSAMAKNVAPFIAAKLPETSSSIVTNTSLFSGVWQWFFVGALFSLIILLLWDFFFYSRSKIR